MPIFHYCEQGSEEHEMLRLGLPTSSNFDRIITPGGKPSKQAAKYAYFLAAERVLNRKINTYTSGAMELGRMMEQDAVADYELQTGLDTQQIGFVTTDDGLIGCSPDRLVGEDGLMEAKCPMPQTQMEYLLTGELGEEYKCQLQGQLFVTGRKWVDIISFNPELPRSIIRTERDQSYIGCLEEQLYQFNTFLKEIMARITERQPLNPHYKFAKFNLPTEGLQL